MVRLVQCTLKFAFADKKGSLVCCGSAGKGLLLVKRVRASEARPRPEEPRSRRFHWEQDRDTLAVIRTDRWTPGRSERTDCDKRPAPRALHYEPRGPVAERPCSFSRAPCQPS